MDKKDKIEQIRLEIMSLEEEIAVLEDDIAYNRDMIDDYYEKLQEIENGDS